MAQDRIPQETALRAHLVELLEGGHAHLGFEKALAAFPAPLRATKPADTLPTAWQLLEHLRIAQWDILEFSRNPKHVSPEWPDGYWPETEAPPDAGAWEKSVSAFRKDLAALIELIRDEDCNLFAPFEHGQGQTLLREALLTADHNAYHLGQMVALRRVLGIWPPAAKEKEKKE